MKKILLSLCVLILSATIVLSGCSLFGTGDVTVNNNTFNLTDEQWNEYLDKISVSGDSAEQLKAAANYSLLSGVSVITSFTYKTTGYRKVGDNYGAIGERTYSAAYCGSGVIVELDGESDTAYVLTNAHVIYSDSSNEVFSNDVRLYLYGQDAEHVNYSLSSKYVTYNYTYVYYAQGNEYKGMISTTVTDDEKYRIDASVVAASLRYDIALLKVSANDILGKNPYAVAAKFADEEDVTVGDRVYTVGNPGGDGMSVTAGIVNKTSETVSLSISDDENTGNYNDYRVIRTDASINAGNSGGGLFNLNGKLIGVINAKKKGGEIDNMGYALPACNVKRLWLLLKDGYLGGNTFGKNNFGVTRAYLSAVYEAVWTCPEIDITAGGIVSDVVETVAVTKSGGNLQSGDVIKNVSIISFSGETIDSISVKRAYHVDDVLLSLRSGGKVIVTVDRNGTEIEVEASCTTKKVA